MKPGPTIIRKCSACGKHILEYTVGSGNTFGARFWTDGKRDAPMLPDQPWLVKCPHCSTLVWIDEQKQVVEIDPWWPVGGDADRFKDARSATEPTFTEYNAFLSAGVKTRKKERYVRLRTWWAGNDDRRKGGQIKPMTDAETANLRALLPLLKGKNRNDRLMKAEAFRELGMFEDAEALLSSRFEEGLMKAVEIIRSLNQSRSSTVAEMNFR